MIDRNDVPPAPRRGLALHLYDWFEGDETCPTCLQLYALEAQVRCVDCDQPFCPFCIVEVRAQPLLHRCGDCSESDS